MILNQPNLIPQSIPSNGFITGNPVQNPNNLLNTTDSVAVFGATTDVLLGNFPFNIPLGAVIVGISGIMKARILNSSIPAGSVTPILVDPSTGQRFPGAPVTGLSGVLQEYAFGGDYDIWGNVAWTPTKINNIQLDLTGNQALEVAWATLTVFYYIPVVTPAPSPFDLPGCDDCDSQIQALPFKLARVWRTNETTLLLESFNDAGGNPITLEMLGECGGTINLTVDPDKSRADGGDFIENFNLLSSIASIQITTQGVELDIGDLDQRGLGFSTPYGHDDSNVSEHAVGAILIITNNGPFNSKLLKRCMVGTVVSAPITVQDENTDVVVAMETLNFIGDNVQAEQDPNNPRKANVTVVANPSNVQPTQEAVAEGTNNTTPSTSLTVPLTIVSANYLRVAVITENETITSVTYNGVAMTLIGTKVNPGVNLKVALFGLINPAVGAHNAVVTMPTPRIITAIVTSWLDVDTTNPVDGVSSGNIGTSDSATDSVTTTSENTVMQDIVGTTNNPTTFTQFGLWAINGDVTTGIRPGASSSRRVLAPQLVNDVYGLSVSTGWAILLAGIRGLAAVPPTGVQSVTSNSPIVPVDNTDPLNPIIGFVLNNLISALLASMDFVNGIISAVSGSIAVVTDGVTITGDGTSGDPLVAVGGGGGGGGGLGAWSTPISSGVPYQALTDGFVVAFQQTTGSGGGASIQIKTDSSPTPSTIRQEASTSIGGGASFVTQINAMSPVRKGDYVQVDVVNSLFADGAIYWIPLSGSGGGSYKSGVLTTNVAAPTVIPHGLGTTPSRVRLSAKVGNAGTNIPWIESTGTYDGINTNTVYIYTPFGTSQHPSATDTTYGVYLDIGAAHSFGVITFDATNITITWSNTGGGIDSDILWEAFA